MTGFMGRMGIYEMLVMSPEIRRLVTAECNLDELRKQAYREGMKPLRISGATKVAQGITTIQEVLSVTPPVEHGKKERGAVTQNPKVIPGAQP